MWLCCNHKPDRWQNKQVDAIGSTCFPHLVVEETSPPSSLDSSRLLMWPLLLMLLAMGRWCVVSGVGRGGFLVESAAARICHSPFDALFQRQSVTTLLQGRLALVHSSRACRGGGTWSRLLGSSATLFPSSSTGTQPLSLASCAFKIFELLVHGRIAPHISDRLDECQGGFHWRADACVYGLLDTLRLREDMHTFCAFVNIRKVFDTSWVEATLVRLHQVGVTGGMWRTVENFFVRVCGDVSPPWVDTGIAQGRVLTTSFHPTCFTWCLTRSTLKSPFHSFTPMTSCSLQIPKPTCKPPLMHPMGPSVEIFLWNRLELSAVMVFGPARSRQSSQSLSAAICWKSSHPYRYLGVVLTPSLWWDAHVVHILARGHRLFAQSTSWARSKGLLASFSATFGTEFVGDCTHTLAQLDLAQQRWGCHYGHQSWWSSSPAQR